MKKQNNFSFCLLLPGIPSSVFFAKYCYIPCWILYCRANNWYDLPFLTDEGTRAAQIATHVSCTKEQLAELLEVMREVQLRLTLLETKQDHTLSNSTPQSSITIPPPSHSDLPALSPFKSMRIAIPRYNGGNPETWIQKIEYYYSFHKLSDHDKLTLTSCHLDGPAAEQFLWLNKTNWVASWMDFLTALHNRFGPSKYRHLCRELAKLMQSTIVEDYQIQFEILSNQITGIDELFLQSCFESGLKPSIRRELRLH